MRHPEARLQPSTPANLATVFPQQGPGFDPVCAPPSPSRHGAQRTLCVNWTRWLLPGWWAPTALPCCRPGRTQPHSPGCRAASTPCAAGRPASRPCCKAWAGRLRRSDTPYFCASPQFGTSVPALRDALRARGIKLRDAASSGPPGHCAPGRTAATIATGLGRRAAVLADEDNFESHADTLSRRLLLAVLIPRLWAAPLLAYAGLGLGLALH